jgi:hypothetical protein
MRYTKTCVIAIVATIMFLGTIWFVRTVYATQLPSLPLSPTTQANVRFTPPLFVQINNLATCDVSNVLSATTRDNQPTRTVRIQIIDHGGRVRNDSGNFVLAAGAIQSTSFFDNSVPNGIYCKFTVVDGSRTDIRGSISVFNDLRTPDGVLNRFPYLSLPAE